MNKKNAANGMDKDAMKAGAHPYERMSDELQSREDARWNDMLDRFGGLAGLNGRDSREASDLRLDHMRRKALIRLAVEDKAMSED